MTFLYWWRLELRHLHKLRDDEIQCLLERPRVLLYFLEVREGLMQPEYELGDISFILPYLRNTLGNKREALEE